MGFLKKRVMRKKIERRDICFLFGPSNKPSISLVLSPLFRHQVI